MMPVVNFVKGNAIFIFKKYLHLFGNFMPKRNPVGLRTFSSAPNIKWSIMQIDAHRGFILNFKHGAVY